MEETRRLLRAAERGALPGTTGGVRDRAIVTVLLFTALRIAELAALNRDDVAISARKGLLTVRHGKGDRYREVPLNAEAATPSTRGSPNAPSCPTATGSHCSSH